MGESVLIYIIYIIIIYIYIYIFRERESKGYDMIWWLMFFFNGFMKINEHLWRYTHRLLGMTQVMVAPDELTMLGIFSVEQ